MRYIPLLKLSGAEDEALNQLAGFKDNGARKYKNIIGSLKTSESYLLTFYVFPKSVWQSIYTTNIIEGFNKRIKKMVKHKEQLSDPDSLERFIVSLFNDYNEKFMMRIQKGFANTSEHWN